MRLKVKVWSPPSSNGLPGPINILVRSSKKTDYLPCHPESASWGARGAAVDPSPPYCGIRMASKAKHHKSKVVKRRQGVGEGKELNFQVLALPQLI